MITEFDFLLLTGMAVILVILTFFLFTVLKLAHEERNYLMVIGALCAYLAYVITGLMLAKGIAN